MSLSYRYSQYAQRALAEAHQLADIYQHDAITPDHLLLGILRVAESLGSRALSGLVTDRQRAELEVRVRHPVRDPLVTTLDFRPDAQAVLTDAAEEARCFGHHYVGTEHLLLALSTGKSGAASALLRVLAIEPADIRQRVRQLIIEGHTELSEDTVQRLSHLSELSRRVYNAAAQQAAENGCSTGIDHLLLVLSREDRSPASTLIDGAGLKQTMLAVALKANQRERAGLVEALDEVMTQAAEQAGQLGMHYTGTEHLLLALAQHPAGKVLLRQYGVDPVTLFDAVYQHMVMEQQR